MLRKLARGFKDHLYRDSLSPHRVVDGNCVEMLRSGNLLVDTVDALDVRPGMEYPRSNLVRLPLLNKSVNRKYGWLAANAG